MHLQNVPFLLIGGGIKGRDHNTAHGLQTIAIPDMQPIARNEPLLEEWRQTLENEIIRSPLPPIDIPSETLIVRILRSMRDSAALHPGKAALIDAHNQQNRLTYQQMHDQSLSVAAFLHSRGFGEGQIATAVSYNCIELPLIHLGVWAAGGIFSGMISAYKHDEMAYQFKDSASSVIFTSEALLETVLTALLSYPHVTKMIICIRSSSTPLPEGIIDFQELIDFPPLSDVIPVSMDSPCFISFTSGTTGLPKGCIHTHRTYHSNIEILRSHFLREIYPILGVHNVDWHQDHQIVTTTCYHMLGFGLLNWWLLTGSPVLLMQRLDETLYPQIIEEFKPRYLFVTPPSFAFLTKHPQGIAASLQSVQLILSSGAPLSQEVSDEFFTHHPTVKYIVQGYGMTETGYSHLPLLLREGANASSGVVVTNYEQKIVTPGTLIPCKRGEWGEILVKGPGLTIGYLNKPEMTKILFDDEGWLHTGDVGYLDELGCIHIVDRVKELIKVNYMHLSIQMPPAELEGVLLSHHKIKDVAVVGIPHENGGELVRAFVVKADKELNGKEVEMIIEDKLAAYKRLTGGVVFIDVIPRSATGKILRRELREK